MKRILCAFVAALLAVSALGCGGDKDKGINKDRDKPRAADKEKSADKDKGADKGDKEKGAEK